MKLGPSKNRLGYTYGEMMRYMTSDEFGRFAKLMETEDMGLDEESGRSYIFPWVAERLLAQIRNGS